MYPEDINLVTGSLKPIFLPTLSKPITTRPDLAAPTPDSTGSLLSLTIPFNVISVEKALEKVERSYTKLDVKL